MISGLSRRSEDPFGTDLADIHLTVHAGEIVGIAGVSGNGQRELVAALSGEAPLADPAAVRLLGVDAGHLSPADRRRLGLGVVPEERLGRGAVAELSLGDNALLTAHRAGLVRAGLIRVDAVRRFARRVIEQFRVTCGGVQAEARSLSGGNLQKFIVGRELLQQPKVLIVSQPTWGVDVGAAAFLRQALIDLRSAGTAILVVSDELDELLEISDRIAVMAQGRLSPARDRRDTDREQVGVWMSGLWGDDTARAGAPAGGASGRAAHA